MLFYFIINFLGYVVKTIIERKEYTMNLPDEILNWIADSPMYDSSGQSGAKTFFIERDGGAYLKIAEHGTLYRAYQMQTYFSNKNMAPPVLHYMSTDKDYLITKALHGEDGTSDKYLSDPRRLSKLYGQTLRILHEIDASDCPFQDTISDLLSMAEENSFRQNHLDDIAEYIGIAKAKKCLYEIIANKHILKNDVLTHGDYCLPNIILDDWAFEGFIDLAEGGIGDRHYDLALGLWTLNWNLKSSKYGQVFLDGSFRKWLKRD